MDLPGLPFPQSDIQPYFRGISEGRNYCSITHSFIVIEETPFCVGLLDPAKKNGRNYNLGTVTPGLP